MGNTYRIVFLATTTTELRFVESDVTFDGDMTTVWQGGIKKFCVPSKNVVAIEHIANVAPAPPPEDEPVPADAS